MCAFLAQGCWQPLRWTTYFCMVMNLEYNIHMIILRDDTCSSITLFNFALEYDVTCSPPYLAACNSLAIRSFLAIKNLTLEMVASEYDFVASANAVGCLHTLDTITHSSNCPGDMWTSGVGTFRDCTTLCCNSLKDMLCISTSRLSSRIFRSA